VRLPQGVFEPYTQIPTNVLFFDRTKPTDVIWFHEVPLPEGRKKYTKTQPMQFEEFADALKWFHANRRKENEHAWRVDFKNNLIAAVANAKPHWDAAAAAQAKTADCERKAREASQQISAARRNGASNGKLTQMQARQTELADDARRHQATAKSEQDTGDAIYWPMFNLDIKNPHSADALEHLPPEELAEAIAAKAQRIGEIMQEVKEILATEPASDPAQEAIA